MAGAGDDVTDSSVPWPEGRTEIPFGVITLSARVDEKEAERRKIIFDPIPRVDGIDTSGDPLSEVRSEIYLLSGRRRRAAAAHLNRRMESNPTEARGNHVKPGRV